MTQRKLVLSIAVIAITAVSMARPGSATADVSRLGPTFTAVDFVSTRYSDIAYDPVNDVYLTVAQAAPGGVLTAFGRFVSGAGAPLGAQQFTFAGNGGKPRVSYGNGKFLVTWYDYRSTKGGQVYGRFATYDPATGGGTLGPEFVVNTAAGFLNTETSSPVSAYSTGSDEFLVVWMDQGGVPASDIHGQRVSSAGALLGGVILISYDNNWQAEPAVAYNASANTFYVAWANYIDASRTAGIHGRRVQAGTGALPEQYSILFNGAGTWIPNVVNNAVANNFLVGWYTNVPAPTHYGQIVGTDGVPVGSPAPLVSCAGAVCYASYDGFSIAHNTSTNTYVAVLHGRGADDVGTEILPTGVPTAQGIFGVTDAGARKGNYYPKIAASTTSAKWMLTTATDFLRESAQLLQSTTSGGGGVVNPPPPPPPPTEPDPTAIDYAAAVNGTEYFAEGFASNDSLGFATYYQIANPNDIAASVRMYFAKQSNDGTVTLKQRTINAPARSRTTVDLAAQVGYGPWSAVVQSLTADAPVTTQQSVYWGAGLEGSSSESAARTPSTQWLFAEGSRVHNDFFANYFLLFNPNAQAITVLGEYFGPNSTTPIIKPYTVPPFSRYTIYANGEIPDLAGQDFSTRFRAADGVSTFVTQRAMYWGPNWTGGHSSVGATAAQPTWLFSEGAAVQNFDTWFTLLNPNAFEVTVNITYLTESSGTRNSSITMPANSRRTVYGNGDLANLGVPNVGGFSTTFNAVGGYGIIVERSIYWGTGGFQNWVEGTNDVGINSAAMSWDVPEGSDNGSFDTYILVANPNAFPVNVQVQFFLEGGGRITVPSVTVAATKRFTIDMNAPRNSLTTMSADDAALLAGKNFSTRVSSLTDGGSIIVEEAIYRNWTDAARWRAGSSAFGVPR